MNDVALLITTVIFLSTTIVFIILWKLEVGYTCSSKKCDSVPCDPPDLSNWYPDQTECQECPEVPVCEICPTSVPCQMKKTKSGYYNTLAFYYTPEQVDDMPLTIERESSKGDHGTCKHKCYGNSDCAWFSTSGSDNCVTNTNHTLDSSQSPVDVWTR
jgi:hypothetical protein